MFEDECKLYKIGEHEWGRFTVSENILEELSELNCNEHEDSDPLRQFFVQHQVHETEVKGQRTDWKAQSYVWDAVTDIDMNDISAGSVETEMICVDEDEKTNTERAVVMSVDQNAGGDSLQNDALNLICCLDEQMATAEQLSTAPEQLLVHVLPKLSDTGLCHICTLVCSMSASEQSKLGSHVCRLLIFPRLQEKGHEPSSRAVVKALVKFTKSLPHLSCTEVLLPIMLISHTINEKDTVLQIITEALGPQHKENLLRHLFWGKAAGA